MNPFKILRNSIRFIDLKSGEENHETVREQVKSNTSFRGSNLWILACAIVVACIGLNVNSTAVIIGAMLISPLMGPIVGAGFALGTFDFELLKKSGKNLLIATLVSLLVAAVYFYISPFKEAQSELLARTSPNIYDVLIAIFGGLVGVIAITRVEKGNPIPGVAIATALMPPLCTAGYGIAIGNLSYFLGAFYLYTINCFFICIATFFIIKFLKYKPIHDLNTRYEKKIRVGITTLIFIMIIPSFYLAYDLLQQKKYNTSTEAFLNKEFIDKGYTIIYKKTDTKSNPKKIELAFLAKQFTREETAELNKKLAESGIKNTTLTIIQDVRDIKSEIRNEMDEHEQSLSKKEIEIKNLKKELASYKFENTNIVNEMAILFPEYSNVSLGKHVLYQNTDSAKTITMVVIKTSGKYESKANLEKLQLWLEEKLKTKNIEVIKIR